MAIVYKTSSEQNRVFIPLKFDYEFNNPGFNTAIDDFVHTLESLGSENPEDIVKPIKNERSLTDGSSKNLQFFEEYDEQRPVNDITVGKWHSEYNYIESMQYDYKNNNCIKIKLSDFSNIPTIGVGDTFIPVIIEFTGENPTTYSPVFLVKNDGDDSGDTGGGSTPTDRHNTYIHLQIICSNDWTGYLSSVSINGHDLAEILPDDFDKNNPSGYEFDIQDNKVSEGDDTHMDIYVFDTEQQKGFDFNTLDIKIDTNKNGYVNVKDMSTNETYTFGKRQNGELYTVTPYGQSGTVESLSAQWQVGALKDGVPTNSNNLPISGIQINVILINY